MLALDLDGGEAGRQRAAGHHMLRSDYLRPSVEIGQVAAAHIDGAEAETRVLPGIQAVAVDEALERGFERPGVIIARCLDGAGRMKPWIEEPRTEEARRSGVGNHSGAHLIDLCARSLASKEAAYVGVEAHGRGGDFLPELPQPVGASLGRIASDDRSVDGADRDADDPVGMEAGFGQRLIDARLIGAERPPPCSSSATRSNWSRARRFWPWPMLAAPEFGTSGLPARGVSGMS